MEKITVEKIDQQKKSELDLPEAPEAQGPWAVWECEPSTFDWQYAQKEIAYIYEGKVKVKTESEEVEINQGDLVAFPKGLSCTWNVIETIRKVYKFE